MPGHVRVRGKRSPSERGDVFLVLGAAVGALELAICFKAELEPGVPAAVCFVTSVVGGAFPGSFNSAGLLSLFCAGAGSGSGCFVVSKHFCNHQGVND